MSVSAEYKFLQQQGFLNDNKDMAKNHYNALLFQPIIVSATMLIAIIIQSATIFLVFSGLLWTNTIFPKANPFERLYVKTIGKSRGVGDLEPAPAPRRFMQGMAASLMLIAGLAILSGFTIMSYIAQGLILIAFSLLLFGKFCVGAYVYHLLHGNAQFANGTCPWSK
jgi:hypothetical protein